jgi:uncharacterized membrane protein YvbJ
MIECLNCGKRRDEADCACPRCGYVGWARANDLDEALRRLLRERPPERRRAQPLHAVK